jgi:hypothetical protein
LIDKLPKAALASAGAVLLLVQSVFVIGNLFYDCNSQAWQIFAALLAMGRARPVIDGA